MLFIYTKRDFEKWPSWDIVYEWESLISKDLQIRLVSSYKYETLYFHTYFGKVLRHPVLLPIFQNIDRLFTRIENISIVFEMFSTPGYSYAKKPNSIPWIIDFFQPDSSLSTIIKSYSNCPLVFVSSAEVIDKINALVPVSNFVHMPLSLPDKYRIQEESPSNKKNAILMAGRPNKVLFEFMKKYAEKNSHIEYVYQQVINGNLEYVSNKNGSLGSFNDRESYFKLLKQYKIALYSTPGIDGGELRTHGYNPVTPRFLELISAGCLVLGRYKSNAESRFYNLEKVCPNIDSYDDFEFYLNGYLKDSRYADYDMYSNYLESYYTTSVINKLAKTLKEKGIVI